MAISIESQYRAENEFGFSCKFDECPEAQSKPRFDCVYQFTIDSCCTDNLLCDKEIIEKLPRCWSNGHEFVKGNLIYSPNSPCYKCLCDENYDNTTDISQSPSCKPVECGIELHQLSYLQLGCIPVYFNDGLCCPFEFKCREYAFCHRLFLHLIILVLHLFGIFVCLLFFVVSMQLS